jgi:hypothetical protein
MATTNKITSKSFWFNLCDDYRTGRSINTYTKPPVDEDDDGDDNICSSIAAKATEVTVATTKAEAEDVDYTDDDSYTPEEAAEINFSLPTEGMRVYIVNEYPDFTPVWHVDVSDDADTNQMYLKIFSQIHDCMPFQVTGLTSAYKEDGYWPDVPDDIKQLPNIIDQSAADIIKKRVNNEHYFLFIVDSDGYDFGTHLLNPLYFLRPCYSYRPL